MLHRATVVAAFIGLLALKLAFNPFPFADIKSDDGAYYYQVARHVANGDGLLTDVSVFHHGFASLPHRITYYPLWPLVLGWSGRVIGLERAASLVPEMLYFTALGLIYVFTERVGRAWAFKYLGVLAVLLLGLNPVFFEFTSLPFTEGLAFTIAIAGMVATCWAAQRASVAPGVLVGLCIGGAFLARSQFIALLLALPGALLFVRWRSAVVAFSVGAALIAGWGLYVSSGLEHFTWGVILDPVVTQELPALGPYEWQPATATVGEWLSDRARGVPESFAYSGRFSFVRSWSVASYMVLLAGGLALARWRSWRLNDPHWTPILVAVLVAVGCLLPVYAMHARGGDWYFSFRYGIPMIFAIVAAVPFLRARHWTLGVMALSCVAITIAAHGWHLRRVFQRPFPRPAVRELQAWMSEQNHPVMLATNPSMLAAATGERFHHWVCFDGPDKLPLYTHRLGLRYVISEPNDERCAWMGTLRQEWTPVATLGKYVVWTR